MSALTFSGILAGVDVGVSLSQKSNKVIFDVKDDELRIPAGEADVAVDITLTNGNAYAMYVVMKKGMKGEGEVFDDFVLHPGPDSARSFKAIHVRGYDRLVVVITKADP